MPRQGSVGHGRRLRRFALALGVAASSLALPVVAAPAANADDWLNRPASGSFTVRGHGEGHGRGMSQYGAQGAAGQGLSSAQILDFYYPGTTATGVDPRRPLRVWISGDDDASTEVIWSGDLQVRDDSSGALLTVPAGTDRIRTVVSGSGFAVQFRVGGSWQDAAGAAALSPEAAAAAVAADSDAPPPSTEASYPAATPDAASAAESDAASAPATADPATSDPTTADPATADPTSAADPSAADVTSAAPTVSDATAPTAAAEPTAAVQVTDPTATATTEPAGLRGSYLSTRAAKVGANGPVSFRSTVSGIVEVVTPSGDRVGYRGTVRAVRNGSSSLTVDELALDDYVRAVVPRESPSSWRPAALQSQAVAARSYANGYRSTNSNYDICDTAACQVYGGATRNGVASEVASTDAATAATAGLVRTYNGAPINAQFGSTNGGWTVDGGTPYLIAQVDPYEALANPPQSYANWTGTLTAASLESRYPVIGSFTRIRITQRDGNGEWGGRVLAAEIQGTAGSKTLTSDQLRLSLTANVRSAYYQIFDPDAGNAPVGNLDTVAGNGSAVSVVGWAFDPNDVNARVPVHVYDTAPSGAVSATILTADGNRGDVAGAFPGVGAAHGFNAVIGLSGRGVHQICVYAINVGTGSSNTTLGCRAVSVGSPFGALDIVSGGGGYVSAFGWAIDPNTPTAATQIHLYVTNAAGTVGQPGFVANQSRTDVAAAYPGSGAAHGYIAAAPVGVTGPATVCAYAIATDGSSSSQLGCRSVNVVNPIGRLDVAAAGGGGIVVGGWALNPGAPGSPLEVHVYVRGADGVLRGYPGTIANLDRPDIAGAFPGVGNQHGFGRIVPAGSGATQVCVYAISNGPSTTNPQLGCATVNVP